jgi:hypothetical protein
MVTLTGRPREVWRQLCLSGYAYYVEPPHEDGDSLIGSCSTLLRTALLEECARSDRNFTHLGFSPMHGGLGRDEFRSVTGRYGPGSLQIVITRVSPSFDTWYADLDRWNPLQSVGGFLAHNLGEVFVPWVKGLFQRRNSA